MAEEQAKDKIIKKALTDSAFKKALLADPNAAIEKELGEKMPDGAKVVVLEDKADTVHLVLPVIRGTGQLSDDDLDKVSGGAGRGGDRCGNLGTFWPVPFSAPTSEPICSPNTRPNSR